MLSHTRGLKLIALGATRRFAEDRDPSKVGRELGADSIVDGTVQLAGERVRLSARLVDPAGVQVWSERFDGRFEDVFALQESMGRRVAEALRLELSAIAACVIGGTSLMGGRGSVIGSFIGVLIISVLQTGLAQLGVSDANKQVVTGVVIVAAVLLDALRRRWSAAGE